MADLRNNPAAREFDPQDLYFDPEKLRNVLELATPVQLDNSTQLMLQEWNRIRTLKKDILVIAHSEGAIFTQAGLWRFRTQNPFSFGPQTNDLEWANTRMHVLVFGTGFHFFTRFALPEDYHMVHTDMDRIALLAGMENGVRDILDANTFDIFNWNNQTVRSHIVDYQGPQFDSAYDNTAYEGYSGHSWFTDLEEPNSYSWWSYWVGGPTFQKKDFNIHGEKAWVPVGDVDQWVYAYLPRDLWRQTYPTRERDKRVILRVTYNHGEPASEYPKTDHHTFTPREGMPNLRP